MFKPITDKGIWWELRHSIWVLWTLFIFGFFNYISFFYSAARLKDKKLFGYGVLYALPFINFCIVDSMKKTITWYENISIIILIIGWITSIFHVLKVRKMYLLKRAGMVSYEEKLKRENEQLQRQLCDAEKQQLQRVEVAPIIEPPVLPARVMKEAPIVQPPAPPARVMKEAPIVQPPAPPVRMIKEAPIVQPPAPPVRMIKEAPKANALLDLNVANEQQLSAIEEIGSLLAAKIIDERQQVGSFTSYNHFAERMNFKPHIAHKLKKVVTVIPKEPVQTTTSPKKGRVIDF